MYQQTMDIPGPLLSPTQHGLKSEYHVRFTSIIFKVSVKSKLMLVSARRHRHNPFQQSVLDSEWILLTVLAADPVWQLPAGLCGC